MEIDGGIKVGVDDSGEVEMNRVEVVSKLVFLTFWSKSYKDLYFKTFLSEFQNLFKICLNWLFIALSCKCAIKYLPVFLRCLQAFFIAKVFDFSADFLLRLLLCRFTNFWTRDNKTLIAFIT